MNVDLSDEAEAQVNAIDAWWRSHRLAAPDLFTDELARALTALGDPLALGTVYRAGTKTARRLLLRRTHYHVYFVEESTRVYVVAVWCAFRGRGPKL